MLNAISSLWQQEICPYCFEHFKMTEAPFRCMSKPQNCSGADVDSILKKEWGIGKRLPPVLEPATFSSEVACPDCGESTSHRLCPHCHSRLPNHFGEQDSYIFSLVGGKEAGKSHYIASLIREFRKRVGPSLNYHMGYADDQTGKKYRNEFRDPVFENRRCLDETKEAAVQDPRPLVFSLTQNEKNMFGTKPNVMLSFFDTAGEDLKDEDTLDRENRYIYQSDGIILLLDPLQLNEVRERLSGDVNLPYHNSNNAELIERVGRLIQNNLNLSSNEEIDIPIAVAFSKIDALDPLLEREMEFNRNASHNDGFDVDDARAVHHNIEGLLENWGCRDILAALDRYFQQTRFFGVTALGCDPDGNRLPQKPLPKRVEDPFLWLLYQHGLINEDGA